MKRWKKYAAGLLLAAGLSSQAHAQVPAAPAAAAPAAAAPAPAPAAAPGNIWSMVCLTPEQMAACKAKFCNCALGQMLNNGLKPMGAFTGGIIGPCCPLIPTADLAKPADSAEGAAARVAADEAGAKARREAVRFLGTVDCHYWPEAQEALINALRGDRNECVRLEAAFALNRGCCCTKIIIKALVMTVSGNDEDGFPSERSCRVRAVAQAALAHCLECYTEVVPVPPEKDRGKEPVPPPREAIPVPPAAAKPLGTPEKLPTNLGQQMTPIEYYKRVEAMSRQEIIADSQRVLSHLPPVSMPVQAAQDSAPNGLLDVFQHAFGGTTTTVTTTIVPQTQAPAVAMKTEPVSPVPPQAKITTVIEKSPSTPPPLAPVKTTTTVDEKSPSAPPPLAPVKTITTVVEKSPSSAVVVSSNTAAVSARSVPSVPAAMSPAQPAPVAQKAVQQPAPAANTKDNGMNMTLPQVVRTLRESPYAEYRSWAAENLCTVDGWTNPDVVQALATAARTDHTPTVRAACVRSLGKMRCGTMVVLSTMQAAKADPDSHVRQEAELALQLITNVDAAGLKVPSGH